MFKFIFNIIKLAIFLIILVLIFHTWIIKQAAKFSLEWSLGAPVSIEAVKMDWPNTGFDLRGLQIKNPEGFPDAILADIPLAIVSVDLPALKGGRLYFKTIGVDLKRLYIVHAPKIGLNILSLKAMQKEEPKTKGAAAKPKTLPMIGELVFSMRDITLVDLLGDKAKQETIHVGIRGATYHNLENIDDLVYILAMTALKQTGT